jgi:cell division inhibitor SepF
MGIRSTLSNLLRPYDTDGETEPFADFTQKKETAPIARSSADPIRKQDKVLEIHTTTQLQVVLVQPEKFDAAPDIADHLRDRRTVLLNLEKANKEAIRRLVDFLSGVVYAQGGKIKPVAKSTYLITPHNVEIMGGEEIMQEIESSGWEF